MLITERLMSNRVFLRDDIVSKFYIAESLVCFYESAAAYIGNYDRDNECFLC